MQTSYKRTDQQEEIVNTEVNTLVVNALSGTGKTSTLVDFSEARKGKSILYLAFNRAIVDEAKGKFPSNVKIMTSHGVAFSAVGKHYADAGKLVPSIKPYALMDALKLKTESPVPPALLNLFTHRIISTLNKFISSRSENITPEMAGISSKSPDEIKYFNSEDIAYFANSAWAMMADLKDPRLGMTHDGYLKLYSEMGSPMNDYDYILFDEAQDSTPVTLNMIAQQESKKVFVGDPHQAIYGFRGAIDALDKIEYDRKIALTNSFRFGGSVAGVANLLLAYKGSENYVSGMRAEDAVEEIDRNINHAFISRGNMTILDEAVTLLNMNKKIHFIGGFEGYRFSQLMDVYNLRYRSGEIRDPFVASFADFDSFSTYAEDSMDYDYLSRASMVTKYERKIPQIIAKAERSNVPARDADALLTTAHKAKGLEFDYVRLADDFLTRSPLVNEHQLIAPITEPEEVNLAYVAATRAKKGLDLGTGESNIRIGYENEGLRALMQKKAIACGAIAKLNKTAREMGEPVIQQNRKSISI